MSQKFFGKLVLRAFLLAFASQTPFDAAAAKPLTVVALGDSTTAGTPGFYSPAEAPPDGDGDERSQYAYWILKRHPEWRIHNRGIRGQRSDEIRARFAKDVLSYQPDVVVILAGVNDVYQGYSAEAVKLNLRAMYDEASKNGIRVVACTVLPYDYSTHEQKQKIAAINAWIEEHSFERGFYFCDTYAAVADPARPGKLRGTEDGIHPDIEGYRLVGEAVAEALEKLG